MGHNSRMNSLEHELGHCSENLIFTLAIEHLRLTNMTHVKISYIKESQTNQILIRKRILNHLRTFRF